MDFKKVKNEKGITLIALAVTIVVLLILAGVSINATFGQNGIISKAQEAQEKINASRDNDLESINWLNTELDKIIYGLESDVASKEKSYVGYFADLNGDGKIDVENDGIIYADLAVGGSGQWYDDDGDFSYAASENKEGLKDYYITEQSFTIDGATGYGTKQALKVAGSGEDRFYVMALKNVTNSGTKNNRFTWYDAAYDDGITEYESITSTAFGEGKNNTTVMINSWNGTAYGAQNDNTNGYLDMWGVIQEENKQGWFVPSKEEWSAFAQNLEITSSNYGDFGLSYWYWSSSLSNSNCAWDATFDGGYMGSNGLGNFECVRLSATF